MSSHKDNMEMMHFMCTREVEQLQKNLAKYLLESTRIKRFVNSYDKGKNTTGGHIRGYALAVYDNYMSNLEVVIDLARKFNIHLQLKPLSTTITSMTNYEVPQRSFTDFLQWNSFRHQQANPFNLILTDVGENCSIELGEQNSYLKSFDNRFQSSGAATLSPPPSPLSSNRKMECNKLTEVKAKNQTAPNSPNFSRKVHFSSPSKLKQFYPQLLPRNLSYFTVHREFAATITYVENYEKLIFYVCHLDNPEVLNLSTMRHLRQLQEPPMNSNQIFGVSICNDSILRAVLHQNNSLHSDDQEGRLRETYDSVSETETEILLIDFGEIVALDETCILYEIPLKYQNIPMQAIKCVLVGVNEKKGNEEQGYLANILQQSEFKKCFFRVVQNLGKVLHVLLLIQGETEENHTTQWQSMMTAVNDSVKNLNPFIFSSDDDGDLRDYEVKVTDSSDTSPEVSPHFVEQCLTVLPKESKDLLNDDKISDSAAKFDQLAESKNVSPKGDEGIFLIVTATYVEDIEYFYAQIEKDRQEPLEPLIWNDDEVPGSHRLVQAPRLGELILAKYNKDNLWYRAKVVDIFEEKNLYRVFYVDYGNKEIVSLGSMAKCLLFESEEPYRAVRCHLANISPIIGSEEKRFQQALNSLCLLIVNQTFEVKVLHRSESELLIEFTEDEFLDVPKTLIRLGYAIEKENLLPSHEQK